MEHASVACTIQLYSAFTLSATRSGVDQIRARYRLIHQYGALVRNALNDSFLSLPQVYVLCSLYCSFLVTFVLHPWHEAAVCRLET